MFQDPSNGVYYEDNTLKRLVLVPDTLTEYVIPASVEIISGGSEIESAFREARSLKKLTFANGSNLTQIERYGCASLLVEEFDLSPCLNLHVIGFAAFRQSKFKRIQLPPNLQKVETAAFALCSLLETVNFPDSLIEIDGWQKEGAPFSNCPKLSIYFSPTSNLTSIGSVAFAYSYIPKIYLPRYLRAIGNKAFAETQTTEIEVHPENSIYSTDGKIIYADNMTKLIYMLQPGGSVFEIPYGIKKLGQGSLSYLRVDEIIIPETVTEIEGQAFVCSSIKSIKIPSNVTTVSAQSFATCYSLQEVNLPSSIRRIPSGFFMECMSLANITIPSGITQIESEAFKGCKNLQYVYIPASVSTIMEASFADTHQNIEIIFESGSCFSIRNNVLMNAEKTQAIQYVGGESEEVKLEKTVEEILASAFEKKTISSIGFPDGCSLKYIRKKGFAFSSLTTFCVPHSLIAIESEAFSDCNLLTTFTFENDETQITIISTKMLQNSKIVSIHIPSNIISIESEAFLGCLELKEVEFIGTPRIQSIGDLAFSSCGIESITFPESLISLGLNSFSSSSISYVEIEGKGIQTLPIGCFSKCSKLEYFDLPNGLYTVDSESFEDCSIIERVIISESVSTIAASAFRNCPLLSSVQFKTRSNISSILGSAFSGCSSLTSIFVPSSNKQLSSDGYVLYNYERTSLIVSLPTIESLAFQIPSTVESIEAGAFTECTHLRIINITKPSNPSDALSLRVIGYRAFANCYSLEFVEIPPSVERIGSGAFAGCSSLHCGSILYGAGMKEMLLKCGLTDEVLSPCASDYFTLMLKPKNYVGLFANELVE